MDKCLQQSGSKVKFITFLSVSEICMPGAIRDSGVDWNVQLLPYFLKPTIYECSKCCRQAGAMDGVEICHKNIFQP